MPVTGIYPITIEALTRTWKPKIAVTPITTYIPARSLAFCALSTSRRIRPRYNNKTTQTPMKPCSSASAARMKSEYRTGTKPSWFWLQHIKQNHGNAAEQNQSQRVFLPIHRMIFVHARELVENPLHRPHHRVQPGAIATKHSRHEPAQRL